MVAKRLTLSAEAEIAAQNLAKAPGLGSAAPAIVQECKAKLASPQHLRSLDEWREALAILASDAARDDAPLAATATNDVAVVTPPASPLLAPGAEAEWRARKDSPTPETEADSTVAGASVARAAADLPPARPTDAVSPLAVLDSPPTDEPPSTDAVSPREVLISAPADAAPTSTVGPLEVLHAATPPAVRAAARALLLEAFGAHHAEEVAQMLDSDYENRENDRAFVCANRAGAGVATAALIVEHRVLGAEKTRAITWEVRARADIRRTSRGDAAAATRIVRESRRRRGRAADSPRRRVAATPRPRRG